MAELTLPFEGLPDGWVAAFTVALAVILAMFSWTVLLFARAQRDRRRPAAGASRRVRRLRVGVHRCGARRGDHHS